ncbi:uncharacterized protein ARMOST_07649 [Armillaria ostoyae]|uniref:Uncharacterized protein n=1 Tax=Armillaria ostoyae TaxID=47428 RepID=A0A284R6D8_ARMOS|nr:uncharacterized protein ARMOST_07649 [Armillaria ostoyae]
MKDPGCPRSRCHIKDKAAESGLKKDKAVKDEVALLLMLTSLWKHIVDAGVEELDGDFFLSLSRKTVAQHVHQYYTGLLTDSINGRERLSLLERVLALHMFNKDNGVQSANYLTSSCARIQRGLYSSQFHAAFLGGYKVVYNIPSHQDLYETELIQEADMGGENIEGTENADIINDEQEEIAEEVDEEEHILMEHIDGDDKVISDLDLTNLCHLDFGVHQSDASIDVHLDDSSARDIQEEPGLIEFLVKNQRFISFKPDIDTTIMSRLKFVWYTAKPIADTERGNTSICWSMDGNAVTLTWGRITGREIKLSFLREAVQDIMKDMMFAVEDLPLFYGYQDFDLAQVTDSPSNPESLFCRPDNSNYFKTFSTPIMNVLKLPQSQNPYGLLNDEGCISTGALRSCLKRHDNLLCSMIPAIVMTCGITLRSMQIPELRFKEMGGLGRNIKIVDGHVIIFKPKAKQTGISEYQAAWALPHKVGKVLLYYIGVLRAVEIALLKDQPDLGTTERESLIFVHPKTAHGSPLSTFHSTEINAKLKASSIKLDIAAIRHVQIAFMRAHAPPYFTQLLENTPPADKDSETYYTMDSKEALMIELSLFLHAFYGLGPRPVAYSSHLALGNNSFFALLTAQHLVVSRYLRSSGGNPTEISNVVADTIEACPFYHVKTNLDDKNTAKGGEIGDDVLRAVASVYIYGESIPAALSFAPVLGYDPKDLANVVEYWKNGSFQDLSETVLGVIRTHVQRRLIPFFEDLISQERYHDSYQALCQAIHNYAS